MRDSLSTYLFLVLSRSFLLFGRVKLTQRYIIYQKLIVLPSLSICCHANGKWLCHFGLIFVNYSKIEIIHSNVDVLP